MDGLEEALEAMIRTVIATMATLRADQRQLEHDIMVLVNRLGLSWEQIGEAHDPPISRQAARKRYGQPHRD